MGEHISMGNAVLDRNYTELRLAVNGLILGKVSNIRRVVLCPMLDEHQTGLATEVERTGLSSHSIVIMPSLFASVISKSSLCKTIRSSDPKP
jgi:hypothetical protein